MSLVDQRKLRAQALEQSGARRFSELTGQVTHFSEDVWGRGDSFELPDDPNEQVENHPQ